MLQVVRRSEGKFVSPAGRVLHVEKYKVGNGTRAIVYLEIPTRLKPKRLSLVLERVGRQAEVLEKRGPTKVTDQKLVHALLNLWVRRPTTH